MNSWRRHPTLRYLACLVLFRIYTGPIPGLELVRDGSRVQNSGFSPTFPDNGTGGLRSLNDDQTRRLKVSPPEYVRMPIDIP